MPALVMCMALISLNLPKVFTSMKSGLPPESDLMYSLTDMRRMSGGGFDFKPDIIFENSPWKPPAVYALFHVCES